MHSLLYMKNNEKKNRLSPKIDTQHIACQIEIPESTVQNFFFVAEQINTFERFENFLIFEVDSKI